MSDVATGVPGTNSTGTERGAISSRQRGDRPHPTALIPLELHEDTPTVKHPKNGEPHEDEGDGEQQRCAPGLEPRGIERLIDPRFERDRLPVRLDFEDGIDEPRSDA